MKILYFIHGLKIGGAETIAVEHLIALKKKGVDVALVVYDDRPGFLRDRVVAEGIPFCSILPYCSYSVFGKIKRFVCNKTVDAAKKWRDIVAAEKPDIVHYHDYSEIAKKLCFDPERSVMTFHSDVLRAVGEGGGNTLSVFKTLAENGMTFFALSKKMSGDIGSVFQTDRIVPTGNSIDVEKIRAKAYDKEEFLKTLGIPSGAFVVGHVGRFHPIKNHEKLIDIFNAVLKIKKDAYLLLIGGDHENRIAKIKRKIGDLGIEDKVLFLGVRSDATRIINCFDALVLPSFSESFSLVFAEAQALGVRCVVSDAVPEDVFVNDNCFPISPDRPDGEWADLIIGEKRSDHKGDIFAFDTENVVDKMIRAYSEVLGENDNVKN